VTNKVDNLVDLF